MSLGSTSRSSARCLPWARLPCSEPTVPSMTLGSLATSPYPGSETLLIPQPSSTLVPLDHGPCCAFSVFPGNRAVPLSLHLQGTPQYQLLNLLFVKTSPDPKHMFTPGFSCRMAVGRATHVHISTASQKEKCNCWSEHLGEASATGLCHFAVKNLGVSCHILQECGLQAVQKFLPLLELLLFWRLHPQNLH